MAYRIAVLEFLVVVEVAINNDPEGQQQYAFE